MEQEPVYVPSGQLIKVCEQVLGRIYDHRQANKEQYVKRCVDIYNNGVATRNHKRRWWNKLLRREPEMFITPQGMEIAIAQDIESTPPDVAVNHPMLTIHREYGQLEHEAKDAMIMARYADMVPISPDFARGMSHLGVDPSFMKREPFGFRPNRS